MALVPQSVWPRTAAYVAPRRVQPAAPVVPPAPPEEAAKTIWEKGGAATFDVDRIDEIERVTKHDV
ncbi:hypothetical protein ACIKT0_15545, partial [Hansschlegelia beijingensis]|uniref:hypothetical protein n=1 Tax=Hansschlegelia beijingensis TaxID=1133344 RepID=UPI00387EF0F8